MDLTQLLTNQLPTLVAVILGVPAVLVGYIVAFEFAVRQLPPQHQPRVRPWIWLSIRARSRAGGSPRAFATRDTWK